MQAISWYAAKALAHNWPRNVLVMQIETRLLEHSGKAVTAFAFVGRQVLLDVGGDEFIDPPFSHLKLRCYVVIELKACKFKLDHLGQLGFYLAAVDRQVKGEHDNPTDSSSLNSAMPMGWVLSPRANSATTAVVVPQALG